MIMISILIVGSINKAFYKMNQYFPKPYRIFGGNLKVKLDLSSYAIKAELKGATTADTSTLSAKSDLASLKTEIDIIDVEKSKLVPFDLSKLSNVLNDEVQKRTVGLLKIDHSAKISEIESKSSATTSTTTTSKGSATTSASTTVEDKLPDISRLVKKKKDNNVSVSEIGKKVTNHNHDKYITILKFNKLTTENFTARLAQANIVIKTDFDAQLVILNKKI